MCDLTDGNLTVSGLVTDDVDPTNLRVYFGDILYQQGTWVLENDHFSYSVENWTQHGEISAWVTDTSGLTSEVVTGTV